MLEKIKYINHQGEELIFGENGLFLSESDLLNFTWNIKSKNDKISGFLKGVVSRKVRIVIKGNTITEANSLRNRLYEVFEKDVLAKEYGRFIIGDYYFKCYITESAKSKYNRNSNFVQITLKVISDLPYWIKESHYSYAARGQETVDSEDAYMDYPYDHSYDYASAILAYTADNMGFSEADFKMTIMGPCSAPEITIAGHPYKVNTELSSGEMLVIDSAARKVYKIMVNGEQVNQFHLRDRRNSVFKKIPAGSNAVTWNGSFAFELTLYEGRSEPRWI